MELFSLKRDAVDLAVVLLLAAANVAASGTASEAPHTHTSELDQELEGITRVLAVNATAVERPLNPTGDIVAHHLAAGVRVRVAPETLTRLEASAAGVDADERCCDEALEAWLRLATHEYVAVEELDRQLVTSAYAEASGSLGDAIVAGAANVICGARLLDLPRWFLHRRAWGHHSIGLTYALEAYVAGVRGDLPSLAQAQLITLTRLTRAVTAITMLEHRAAPAPQISGHPRP